MQLKGKMTAFVKQLTTKADKTNDGTETVVDLEIAVKQDEAAKRWGEKFAALAFSGYVDAEDEDGVKESQWLQDRISPARKRFVCDKHRIAIGDDVIEAQPRIVAIVPVDGEPKVTVRVRIPVDAGRTKLISMLNKAVNTEVKVEFNVAQLAMEFRKGAKKAADEREAKAGEVPSANDDEPEDAEAVQ